MLFPRKFEEQRGAIRRQLPLLRLARQRGGGAGFHRAGGGGKPRPRAQLRQGQGGGGCGGWCSDREGGGRLHQGEGGGRHRAGRPGGQLLPCQGGKVQYHPHFHGLLSSAHPLFPVNLSLFSQPHYVLYHPQPSILTSILTSPLSPQPTPISCSKQV